jgi:hypothetical protein
MTLVSHACVSRCAAQVTVIGKIVNVRDAAMTLTLTITDGTGTVDVDHFLNDSDGGQVVRGSAPGAAQQLRPDDS